MRKIEKQVKVQGSILQKNINKNQDSNHRKIFLKLGIICDGEGITQTRNSS